MENIQTCTLGGQYTVKYADVSASIVLLLFQENLPNPERADRQRHTMSMILTLSFSAST